MDKVIYRHEKQLSRSRNYERDKIEILSLFDGNTNPKLDFQEIVALITNNDHVLNT